MLKLALTFLALLLTPAACTLAWVAGARVAEWRRARRYGVAR